MNVQSIIHKPDVVVPDITLENATPQQLIDAVNIRLSKFTAQPGRKIGLRSITGNVIVPNPYLPEGDNYAVGTCTDFVNGRIFFANWNSEGDHAIYVINTNTDTVAEEIKPVIRWSQLDWNKEDYVSMAYDRGILIWCCPNTEPRFINVERGERTEYALDNQIPNYENTYPLPYQAYFFDQLRMPPQDAPIFRIPPNGLNVALWVDYNKPLTEITEQAYQFAYNYEYLDNTESRMSPPSAAQWGILKPIPDFNGNSTTQELFLTQDENNFIKNNTTGGWDAGTSKKVIVAIKWYYRKGNEGEWVYFRKSTTTSFDYEPDGYYPTYGILVPPFDELTSIGPISPAASLLVDGIAKRVVDNVFANNRVVHAGITSGYDIELPSADVSKIIENSYSKRNMRWFVPVERKKQFALVYYDQKDRIIGTKMIGSTIVTPTRQQFVNLNSVKNQNGDLFNQDLSDWNKVWLNSSGYPLNAIDVQDAEAINIVPTAVSASVQQSLIENVSKIGIAEKNQFEIPFFIRTQTRLHFVYKDNDGFKYAVNNVGENFSTTGISGQAVFYGIGFEFSGGEPINASTEQNYHIKIRTISYKEEPNESTSKFFFEKEFKITDIDGPVLISKQNYNQSGYTISDIQNNIFAGLSLYGGDSGGPNKFIFVYNTYYRFSQQIADVVLYSKSQTQDTDWKIIPNIYWTTQQFIDRSPRYYYGDAYGTSQQILVSSPVSRTVYVKSGTPYDLLGYCVTYVSGSDGTSLSQINCLGYFISMNLNGTQLESYTRDIGNVVVMDENPEEMPQLRTYAHGEQYLEGTKVNSWFAFEPSNRRIVTGYIGNIVKVLTQSLTSNQGENLYIHCQKGVEMVFLGKVQQTGTDGTGVLSLSTNIFGTTNTHRLPYGPKHAKQVTQTTRGVSFYFDPDSKVLVQVSNNGQDAVSEQRKFQKDTFRIPQSAAIGFDPFNMEILVTGNGTGLAYNFDEDKYQGRRLFPSSELFAFVSSEDKPKTMYGFYNGQAYRFMNEAISTVSVNGREISQSIKFVSNHELNKHKVFAFIRLLSEYNNSADSIDWAATINGFNINDSAVTEILANEYVKRQYFYQGTIKTNMDVSKFDGPLISGPFVEITLSGGSASKNLIFAEVGYSLPPAQ